MYIYQYLEDRNNNFNFLRLFAAITVIFSHNYALYYGKNSIIHDPLYRMGNVVSAGELAVNIFFIISGFLITMSLLNRTSIISFVFARFLRIMPAFIMMGLVSVIILGVLFWPFSIIEYIFSPDTIKYLKNIFNVMKPSISMNGFFETNVWPNTINGSVWTLMWEIRMYILLTIIGVFFVKQKYIITIILVTSTLLLLANSYLDIITHEGVLRLLRFIVYFFAGSFFYLYKDKIVLSRTIFLVALSITILSFFSQQEIIITICTVILLPYLIIYLAFIPMSLRVFNKFGDYSYGLYIYAFPVQQTISFYLYKYDYGNWYVMLFLSCIITFIFAFFSWHIIEKPALALKPKRKKYD